MRIFPCLLLGTALPLLAQQAPPKEGVTMPFNLIPVTGAAQTVDPNVVVLEVGEIRITAKQLDALIDVYPPNTQIFARGPGKEQFADSLIRMLVLSEEARKRKLNETEKFREQMRFSEANLLSNTLNELLPQEVKADELALRQYYDKHRCEYGAWKARHVVVRFKGSPLAVRPGQPDVSEDEALMRARQLRQRIAGGADFAEIAKAESDDANSGANGGDLGQVRHGQVVPSLEDALCGMKTGEISEPVKTPFGYHVIQLTATEGKEFAEMKGELEPKYRAEAAKKMVEDLISKTRVVKNKEYYTPAEVKDVETKKP